MNAKVYGREEDHKNSGPVETTGFEDAASASVLSLASECACPVNGPATRCKEVREQKQVKGDKLVCTLVIPLAKLPVDVHIVVEKPQTAPPSTNEAHKQPPRPTANLFLKEGYEDQMIWKALRLASDQEFGPAHEGELRYRVGEHDSKRKKYSDHHLMVCLFFYIHLNRLNMSGDFYCGLRGKFRAYCMRDLQKEGFIFHAESFFSRTIKELDNSNGGFEAYIKADKKPEVNLYRGDKDFLFWYEIYQRVKPCFQKVFSLSAC